MPVRDATAPLLAQRRELHGVSRRPEPGEGGLSVSWRVRISEAAQLLGSEEERTLHPGSAH